MWDEHAPDEWEALPGLLDDVAAFLARFVAFPSVHALHAVALWVLHTHVLEAFDSTPRLALLSAEKGSGKTRVLEVLHLLCAGAKKMAGTTAAALFRQIEARQPTVLFDEVDTVFASGKNQMDGAEEIRALINAGHRRGDPIDRCVGPTHQVVEFETFAPVALAGIGWLPDTVIDRSVVIRMRKRAPDQVVEQFRFRRVKPEGHAIRDRLTDWAANNSERIAEMVDAEPEMPPGVEDRPADVWEPLIVIGDAAGPEWSARAREAAVKILGDREDALSLGVQLLADIRAAFEGHTKMKSKDLVDRLCQIEESPWGEWGFNPTKLAQKLKGYEIRPKQQRFEDGSTAKGYEREMFGDAWNRYLPSTPLEAETTETTETRPETETAAETFSLALASTVSDVSPVSPNGGRGAVAVSAPADVSTDTRNKCRVCGTDCVTTDDDGLPCHPLCREAG